MRATAVGPDLSRCIARVEKTVSSGSDTGPTSDTGSADDTIGADETIRAEGPDIASDAGLPLSA
jgi:single-strand DNA-binding protein